MPLAPGTTIGRYRIESRIGAGAMGVVYLALDERLERRVALKLIEPSLAADPDFRARFEREARAAAGLDHPHVLPVYEAGEEDGQLYLAMRYVPGTDLATQLARHGPLDLPSTTRLVTQLAAALDAAHASGLIHRDVKPANVLLAPDQHAYLADFGLARSAGTGITRPGQLVGTADYTAPELLRGEPASPASDTYALTCLAVECLTGKPPFTRDGELATLYAHANDPIPDLSDQLPQLPPGLQAVFERGLAKDPALRYPSAGELAAALAEAGLAVAPATDDLGDKQAAPPRRRWSRRTIGGAAGAVTLAAVMGMVWTGALNLEGGRVTPTPSSSESLTSVPSGGTSSLIGPLAPGAHTTEAFLPGATFTVADSWSVIEDFDAFLSLAHTGTSGRYLSIGKVVGLVDQSMGSSAYVENPAFDVVRNWLLERDGAQVHGDGPYPMGIGSGLWVDLTMAGEGQCLDTCVEFEIGDFDPADGPARFTFVPGGRYRIVVIPYHEATYAFMVEDLDPSDFEAFLPVAEQVIRSFQFPDSG